VTTLVKLIKRPTSRTVDSLGHATVSGGEWEATMSDGRQFVHANKALVSKMVRTYKRGGEAAIADMVGGAK
jgi:hypothetical protein